MMKKYFCHGILIITLIPNLLNVISKALGIYNEINMLFFLGFVFIILVIFSLTYDPFEFLL